MGDAGKSELFFHVIKVRRSEIPWDRVQSLHFLFRQHTLESVWVRVLFLLGAVTWCHS